ncbi:hypothetical protein HWV23_11065 [Natronomonas halophila]|uniref:hypothetical protein n=1 Tax=Natronomonas halophila TaxID=2747817 RepID=UPI0015B78A58|nr:hypothetical protein [Natronomonas halophila]QLD86237.1 hypothetical protein HWV23_11065 [Natronomonas halophila]
MNRRSMLVAVGAAVVGGTTTFGEGPAGIAVNERENGSEGGSHVATEIVDWTFSKDGPFVRDEGADPQVEFNDENERVVVTGVLRVGSSSCYEAAVDFVKYDDGELQTRLISTSQQDHTTSVPCTDDIQRVYYRLVVTFDGGLPERVIVDEQDGGIAERTPNEP